MSAATLIMEAEGGGTSAAELTAAAVGRSLADLLAENGFPLNTRCGQRGLCRGCEVVLRQGTLAGPAGEVTAPATVRACRQVLAGGQVAVMVPARSRIEHRPQVSETFRIEIPCAHQPLFTPQPGGRDTAFAVDVGTTTVVVLLVDLATGAMISRAGAFNDQIRFGDNVLTRIVAAQAPGALAAMQSAVVAGTIAPLLLRACERAGRPPSRLAGGVIAGNTVMLHLLAGEDPTPLGIAPFVPRFIQGRQLSATEIGLSVTADGNALAADTPVQLLPGIAAYIGADITGGVYATGMVYDRAPSLLVDFGTNGEIVLQNDDALTACATAAGPAFEGSGLRCGTRAREGAISDLRISLEPFRIEAETIGQLPPGHANGICGSAYIDFLAEARRCGLLTAAGRFAPASWALVPPSHRIETDDERALRVAPGSGGICISEHDVAVLLQAKAAIGAGIETLLITAGLAADAVSRVYLAGGFGMHLNVANAIAAGLLPGFQQAQVEVVGNTALAGAMLALMDRTTLDEMETLRSKVDVLELNLQGGFEDRFVDHLLLP